MTDQSVAQPAWSLRQAFTRSEGLRGWTLLGLPVVLMLAGLAAPLLLMLVFSFLHNGDNAIQSTFTLESYDYALNRYGPVFIRSLWMSATVTAFTVLIAYPVAYFVAFQIKSAKFVWLILLTIPFWTSYLLRVFAWRVILSEQGIINQALLNAHLIDQPISWLFNSKFAIILTLAHSWAAFAILPIYVSLEKVDRTLLEAAADLGDTPTRSFWRIVFPLSVPGIVSAVVLILVPTIGDYVTPDLVGGPTDGMIAKLIYGNLKTNWPQAAATSMLAMVFVAMVAIFAVQAIRLSARAVR